MPSSGPVYQGRAGQTRTERVHLVELNGAVRSVEVYRVVNVVTDPELRARVLAGQLHRIYGYWIYRGYWPGHGPDRFSPTLAPK